MLYLDSPPSEAGLKSLLGKLGMNPRELMRKGEAVYKEKGLDDPALSEAQLVAAMVARSARRAWLRNSSAARSSAAKALIRPT